MPRALLFARPRQPSREDTWCGLGASASAMKSRTHQPSGFPFLRNATTRHPVFSRCGTDARPVALSKTGSTRSPTHSDLLFRSQSTARSRYSWRRSWSCIVRSCSSVLASTSPTGFSEPVRCEKMPSQTLISPVETARDTSGTTAGRNATYHSLPSSAAFCSAERQGLLRMTSIGEPSPPSSSPPLRTFAQNSRRAASHFSAISGCVRRSSLSHAALEVCALPCARETSPGVRPFVFGRFMRPRVASGPSSSFATRLW